MALLFTLAASHECVATVIDLSAELTTECSGAFTLDTESSLFTYHITLENLEGPELTSHIHGPVEDGCAETGTGPVIIGLLLGSPKFGSKTLTPAEQDDLRAGLWYVNIHTNAWANGEITGHIRRTPVPAVSTWGLVVLALLLLMAGSLIVAQARRIA